MRSSPAAASSIPPTRITNDMLATIMETSDEWIRERSGVEVAPVGRARHVHARALDSGGAPGHRVGRPHAGRHRHGRLRDDDARLLHAGQRLPAAGRARPAERALLRHPPAVQRVRLRAAAGRRARAVRACAQNVLLVGRGGALGVHAVRRGQLGAARRRGRHAHAAGRVGLQHADPPPRRCSSATARPRSSCQALRRRGPRRDRPPHRRRRHRLQPPLHPGRRHPQPPLHRRRRCSSATSSGRRWTGATSSRWPPRRMAEVTQQILARNGVRPDDLSLVLMHQANRRINEYVQKLLGLPDSKVIHNIQKYGNTTAATIPAPVGRGVPRGPHRARGSRPHGGVRGRA
ncbi:MAG: hypothetical protein MZW92_24945 [Comamonadaceae bacterium]|nr:hypothetical protein [Comamonadaceae bacterium]